MRTSHFSLALALLTASPGLASDSKTKTTTTASQPACTAYSHSTGAFFDLSPATARKPGEGKSRKRGPTEDYHVRGYDYGRNFTLNICGPVVDPVEDVVGLGKDDWKNVSAYYTYKGEIYSIGQQSLNLTSHGRMVVLQYTDGSPCGESKSKNRKRMIRALPSEASLPDTDDDNDGTKHDDTYITNDQDDTKAKGRAEGKKDDKADHRPRRKSATLSFRCEPEHIGGQAGISFVAADPDDCAYFFEVRSQHACARAEPHQPGSVGPGTIFAIIVAITVLVYFGGGIFYQRTVAHARGWRQLPNYTLWFGIWSFICDMFIIATSSCARLIPRRRGYHHIDGSPRRGRSREEENRLIDQLDEEWDD
ncbi:hypothetical protein ACRALDRAFT_2044715 [Sodiomyces alcalophilus JCM 7366]|uniref:uncharacterized protein n=1 Tax=Sodiomyces alcalophilus JCM 7366 TaxID=591952 RepID=UPI0039B38E8F